MRTLTAAALGALCIAATAAPAFAQDGEDKEFNGPYIGATLGYSLQNNDVGETIEFDRDLNGTFGDTVVTAANADAFSPGFCNGRATSTANVACENDTDGPAYSGRLGWDFQFGNVVVGAVAEIGKSELSDSVSAFSTTPASYTMIRRIDWDAGLRARVGYAAGGKTLFYATGGGAYARIDHSIQTTNTANTFTVRDKRDNWGWAAGGGVEQKVGKNFSIGLEYLYTSLKDDGGTVRVGAGSAPATNPFLLAGAGGTDMRRSDNRFEHQVIRATAAIRF
jgi:outer membrane immunogenic protein